MTVHTAYIYRTHNGFFAFRTLQRDGRYRCSVGQWRSKATAVRVARSNGFAIAYDESCK